MADKELLFTITRKDCDWHYYRGSGKGGQHRNKKDTAVRCVHRESGAVGQAEDERSQALNKRLAFKRMAESPEFRAWHKRKVAEVSGALDKVKKEVEQEISSGRHLKIEIYKGGKWTEFQREDL